AEQGLAGDGHPSSRRAALSHRLLKLRVSARRHTNPQLSRNAYNGTRADAVLRILSLGDPGDRVWWGGIPASRGSGDGNRDGGDRHGDAGPYVGRRATGRAGRGRLTGWLSWTPHQERLETTRRVTRAQPLVVQLGLENRPVPPGYSIEMEGAALAAAVDMLHPTGRVDLVAWSYGGFLTL